MSHADQLCRFAHALRNEVFDLDIDVASDAEMVLVTAFTELDRLLLDPKHLADQRGQGCHRSTHLTREDSSQLVRLLFRRLVIDEETDPPVAFEHLGWSVRDHRDAMAADVNSVDVAALDVVSEYDLTAVLGPWGGKRRHGAGTCEVAVAVFEVGSLDLPAHGYTPILMRPAQVRVLPGRGLESTGYGGFLRQRPGESGLVTAPDNRRRATGRPGRQGR